MTEYMDDAAVAQKRMDEADLRAKVEVVTAQWEKWRGVSQDLEDLAIRAQGVMHKFEEDLYEAQDALARYLSNGAEPEQGDGN